MDIQHGMEMLRVLFVFSLQVSLQKLMETLNQANPLFIRCIKSNAQKVSSDAPSLFYLRLQI